MSIWFLLWLVLSGALLYFMGWTLYILHRQKAAWSKYAEAKKLRYKANTFTSSPEMSGVLNDYTFSFFTGEHTVQEGRSTRKLTATEVSLSSRMPFDCALGSGGMVTLIRPLGLKEEIIPQHQDWKTSSIAATNNRAAFEAYLTPERLDAIVALMKVKNSWVIFIARGDVMLLRFDTPDPLDNPKKIEMLVQKMTAAAKVLELKPGEGDTLKVIMNRPVRREVLPGEKSAEGPSLELE